MSRKTIIVCLICAVAFGLLVGLGPVNMFGEWYRSARVAEEALQTWEDARYGFWAECANCGKHFYVWVEKSTPILGSLHNCGHCDVLLKLGDPRGYCGAHSGCRLTTVENSR